MQAPRRLPGMQDETKAARGRPRAADASVVAAIALRMFDRDGYEATTMDDIAAAAGISRPTLFRYFPAKNDIVWDRYEAEATELRAELAAADLAREPLDVLCEVLPRLLHYADADLDLLRTQVRLIATVPDVQGHAGRRFADWTGIIAGFVASRSGAASDALLPTVVSQCVWAAGFTALTHWAAGVGERPDADLAEAFAALRSGFTVSALTSAP